MVQSDSTGYPLMIWPAKVSKFSESVFLFSLVQLYISVRSMFDDTRLGSPRTALI